MRLSRTLPSFGVNLTSIAQSSVRNDRAPEITVDACKLFAEGRLGIDLENHKGAN